MYFLKHAIDLMRNVINLLSTNYKYQSQEDLELKLYLMFKYYFVSRSSNDDYLNLHEAKL